MLPAKAAQATNQVWVKYKRTRSRSLRNMLMEKYLPIVKYNAERIAAKLPDEVENDDLISAGV
ncbi:MAG: FliA/WhiG family RNA polymerase sigma factor, partial [Planctomycetota bacterium]